MTNPLPVPEPPLLPEDLPEPTISEEKDETDG